MTPEFAILFDDGTPLAWDSGAPVVWRIADALEPGQIAIPPRPGWRSVTATYHKVKSRAQSPFTLASQVYIWPGEMWSFTFELPPIKDRALAMQWMSFLRDLAAGNSFFNCDVSRYVPPDVGPMLKLRLSSSEASWNVDTAMMFGITFSAEEYK